MLLDYGYDRSESALNSRAHDHMLSVGDVPGYVSVAHMINGRTKSAQYYKVLWEACRDGVLLKLPTSRNKWQVPIEWADKWANEREARRRERE